MQETKETPNYYGASRIRIERYGLQEEAEDGSKQVRIKFRK